MASRSIPIRLQRKARSEHVERFRYSRERADTGEIRDALGEWSTAVIPALRDAEPSLPEELSDRQWDLWEPLLAIADMADRGSEARASAIQLHAGSLNDVSVELLALEHIRGMWNGDDRLATRAILEELVGQESGPWAGWWAHDVDAGHTKGPASRLARLLRPYGLAPKQLWIDGRKERGYLLADLEPVWSRYLTPLPPQNDGRTVDGRSDSASDLGATDLPSSGGVNGTERLPEAADAS